MTIKELRTWINNLPEEKDDNTLVFRKITPVDKLNWGAYDISIVACGIDEGNNEAYFCDEKSAQLIERN